MNNHIIEINEETYSKIEAGQQKVLVLPMSRTLEKKYSSNLPEQLILTVKKPAVRPTMTFPFNGYTAGIADGKQCIFLPLKNMQADLF